LPNLCVHFDIREQGVANIRREELNARIEGMDARMDARFETMDTRIDARFETMDTRIDARFDTMDARIDSRFKTMDARIDARFDAIDIRFQAMDARIDARFDAIDVRFEAIDVRFEAIDARFEAMDSRFGARFEAMDSRIDKVCVELGGAIGTVKSELRDDIHKLRIWVLSGVVATFGSVLGLIAMNLARDFHLQAAPIAEGVAAPAQVAGLSAEALRSPLVPGARPEVAPAGGQEHH
jgi:hypothetical protein